MRKIDWYILRKFLFTFFFCLLLFTVIAVAVDSSEKTDDFVKTGLSTRQIITRYYFGFVPYIWGLLFPLFVFIAVIFFTSRMAMRSEIIAILASGTSYNRFLRPYIIGGVLLGGLLWYATRSVIPVANELRSNFQATYVDKNDPLKNRDTRNTFYKRSDTNTYVGIRYYDTAQKTAGGFFLQRIGKDKLVYNLRADFMQWDTAKKNWRLQNVTQRIVDSMKETVTRMTEMNINLNLRPADLRTDDYLKDKLTSTQLKEFIRLEELRGTEGLNVLKVERYRRDATSVSVLLLTIIAAVISSRKTRGGSGLHIALGFIIASVFVMSDRFSTVFSIKGDFPPMLAAWLPNIVFAAVAFWLYRQTPK
ncbi:MAG: YjgP/YjgQ family permease [Chitinophagaceae bacterium]|nr:MAG: YjgP/YjgQ family permease [Chitinophagaceae bacterium]